MKKSVNENLRKAKRRDDSQPPNLDSYFKKNSRQSSVLPIMSVLKNTPKSEVRERVKRIKEPIDYMSFKFDITKSYKENMDLLGARPFTDAYDFGNCVFSDGDDDYGSFANFSSASGDFTYMTWFLLLELDDSTNYLILTDSSDNSNYFGLRGLSSSIDRIFVRAGTNKDVTVDELELDTWYHLAISHNNTTTNTITYLNGVDVSSGGQTGAMDITVFDQTFKPSGSFSQFIGAVDDMIMVDEVLTAEQVAEIANGGDPSKVITNGINRWWNFNINNGETTVPDIGEDGSDMTLNNFSDTYVFAYEDAPYYSMITDLTLDFTLS